MKLAELKKLLLRDEKADENNRLFPDSLRLVIMNEVKTAYNNASTAAREQGVARDGEMRRQSYDKIIQSLYALPGDLLDENISQVTGTWNLLINYLNEDLNATSLLHKITKKELEECILDSNVFLRYEYNHASGAAMHRLGVFSECIGLAHTAGRVALHDLPLFSEVAASFFLPGALLSSTTSALTRKPLGIQQQNDLFRHLHAADMHLDLSEKEEIINKIKTYYRDLLPSHRLFFGRNPLSSFIKEGVFHLKRNIINVFRSPQSKDLYDKLRYNRSTQAKWDDIIRYMCERKGDCLLNNGKVLFNYINSVIEKTAPTTSFRAML